MTAPIRNELDGDGVLVATIDMADRTMNVFSLELMDALDALMDASERDPAVRSVVVTSGKSSFLAGADLVMVRGYTQRAKTATPEEMFALCGRLGRQAGAAMNAVSLGEALRDPAARCGTAPRAPGPDSGARPSRRR